MTFKIQENDVVRDATPEEIAQRAVDDAEYAARQASIASPTKEQLLAQLNALAAQIQALE
jgi:hypothetical protein